MTMMFLRFMLSKVPLNFLIADVCVWDKVELLLLNNTVNISFFLDGIGFFILLEFETNIGNTALASGALTIKYETAVVVVDV